ncbi:hypothetical protein [Vallicoccus soli]|uniref:Uncharacterized protein n=1 Tax=Vallicoccus soli TaxID=2339232 RepID=A0A3A3YQY0_9ACTN|nr:hypothetical protein [Vallicoccus soli]RJK93776.1 hypothetical protein D5H78_15705 [Vallicoccus soli]
MAPALTLLLGGILGVLVLLLVVLPVLGRAVGGALRSGLPGPQGPPGSHRRPGPPLPGGPARPAPAEDAALRRMVEQVREARATEHGELREHLLRRVEDDLVELRVRLARRR